MLHFFQLYDKVVLGQKILVQLFLLLLTYDDKTTIYVVKGFLKYILNTPEIIYLVVFAEQAA